MEEEGGCPHIFLCDIPDVVHIFDIALMLNSSNGDGLFTYFGGDIFLHFDAQFFEDQVYWAVSIPAEFPARAKNQSWLESDSGEVCLPFTPKPVAVLVQGAHEAIDHCFRFWALPAQASSFPFCPQAHFLLTDLRNQPQ